MSLYSCYSTLCGAFFNTSISSLPIAVNLSLIALLWSVVVTSGQGWATYGPQEYFARAVQTLLKLQ